jgi:tRNA pseudouridine55 synthase
MIPFSQSERELLPDLSGLLVIDKPQGMTSHDVVGRVRRMVRMKRVGHGGTLDPFATGVLVIAVGRATRVLQFVQETDKSYAAHIVLGTDSNSSDIDGTVVRLREVERWPSREALDDALQRLSGTITQIPPSFSAIKVGGRKLYELARAGQIVDVPAREVRVHAIDVLAYDPPDVHLAVRCGKGTYIRSIARDLGVILGTGGYCHALQRTTNGPFCLADAWTLNDLETRDLRESWPATALTSDVALQAMPAVVLGGNDVTSWYHGRSVPLCGTPTRSALHARVYGGDGGFLGVGRVEDAVLKPSLVFPRMDGYVERDDAE